ncbi:MAG: hypothetical protein Q9210_003443 [Variospora velana]
MHPDHISVSPRELSWDPYYWGEETAEELSRFNFQSQADAPKFTDDADDFQAFQVIRSARLYEQVHDAERQKSKQQEQNKRYSPEDDDVEEIDEKTYEIGILQAKLQRARYRIQASKRRADERRRAQEERRRLSRERRQSTLCPICWRNGCDYSLLCGHLYCRDCIGVLEQNYSKCPKCRGSLEGHRIYI